MFISPPLQSKMPFLFKGLYHIVVSQILKTRRYHHLSCAAPFFSRHPTWKKELLMSMTLRQIPSRCNSLGGMAQGEKIQPPKRYRQTLHRDDERSWYIVISIFTHFAHESGLSQWWNRKMRVVVSWEMWRVSQACHPKCWSRMFILWKALICFGLG